MPRDNPLQDCRDDTVPAHVLRAIAQHMEFANFTLAQILQTQNDLDRRLSRIEEGLAEEADLDEVLRRIRANNATISKVITP